MRNYESYRINEISAKINRAGFVPLDVMVTGVTGAGKSTTLNTFLAGMLPKSDTALTL